jgi:3-dehydro-L-gulonate 2-dehydrogenase
MTKMPLVKIDVLRSEYERILLKRDMKPELAKKLAEGFVDKDEIKLNSEYE